MQTILNGHEAIATALSQTGCHRYMLVCGQSFPQWLNAYKEGAAAVFDSFSSNPTYEQVCQGVAEFRAHRCDGLLAVGGGSAIDVAKCIKLYCRMDDNRLYLEQEYTDSGVPLIAVPTTAGTGSESTRYAVIYHEGQKQSVTHPSIIPDYAVLEPRLLQSLPLYQKKCTLLDALCQGIESLWSVNSSDESILHSKIAIQMIMQYYHGYLHDNDEQCAAGIMMAANQAGQAINISQTTAPHAMSYKLSSLYGLPHGHAVALSMPYVWLHILENTAHTIDPRGEDHLRLVLEIAGRAMGCDSPEKGMAMFRALLFELDIQSPTSPHREADIDLLTASVNPIRLANNPVSLTSDDIRHIYERIVD